MGSPGRLAALALVVAGLPSPAAARADADPRVLVFSRTAGFRHASIPDAIRAVSELGRENGIAVEATEDPRAFSDAGLAPFRAVVFLNTTGDVLDDTQQAAFERYIHSGGGFVGVHSAADTEYGWRFYLRLVGATFRSHGAVQPGELRIEDRGSPASAGLPDPWRATDEWYDFRGSPRGKAHVLVSLDDASVDGDLMGADHPIAWYRELEGGRSFYTARGHTSEAWAEPEFRSHLLGGLRWAAGLAEAAPGTSLPDASGLATVVLDEGVRHGMELEVAPDGSVLFVERDGLLKRWRPESGQSSVVGTLDVESADEYGLLGLALDPGFASNGWIYLFYSPRGVPEQRVARFTLGPGGLDPTSERVLLRIPLDRSCCHAAGSLAFAPDGNLFISAGDDTDPFESDGFAPLDERPGRRIYDAQRTSANTRDLRGKILRVRPEPDGGYAVPEGNLFPGGVGGRPEIYVMGCRNPFRFGIHPETGWLYWGDVGPDASSSDPSRGPAGHDELNLATGPGNYGWPYFVGDNQPYRERDFASGAAGAAFVDEAPLNLSPNNTGAQVLPPARGALVSYPYPFTPAFPELGAGMRTLIAGPVYHRVPGAPRSLPERFEGMLLVSEWVRNLQLDVRLDAAGGLARLSRLPDLGLHMPIDFATGGDGALYVLEYGPSDYFFPGLGRLVRIEGTP